MKPRVTVVTLGVDDLNRAVAFYRDGLGLATEGIIGTEIEDGAVAFFKMNNDTMLLALWPRGSLARGANVPLGPRSSTDFAIGHNLTSKGAVDATMRQAADAGATITDPARDRAWGGYSGCFTDPDGHIWEIVWNPRSPVPGFDVSD
jgi:catechol 2,3-dioxygenase-like lactoylglutathione lyase family enzyme